MPGATFRGARPLFHALVGHEHTDFVGVLFQQLQPVLSVGGRVDAELLLKCTRKVFQRLLFVIDVEDRVFFVIVQTFHSGPLNVSFSLISTFIGKLQRKFAKLANLGFYRDSTLALLHDAVTDA
jgi:hypothetical protein